MVCGCGHERTCRLKRFWEPLPYRRALHIGPKHRLRGHSRATASGASRSACRRRSHGRFQLCFLCFSWHGCGWARMGPFRFQRQVIGPKTRGNYRTIRRTGRLRVPHGVDGQPGKMLQKRASHAGVENLSVQRIVDSPLANSTDLSILGAKIGDTKHRQARVYIRVDWNFKMESPFTRIVLT